jgi:hypothetical protein
VRNARAKYGNDDVGIYNFEETGFITDIVTSAMVVIRVECSGKP